jgi:hypothetical protein
MASPSKSPVDFSGTRRRRLDGQHGAAEAGKALAAAGHLAVARDGKFRMLK